MMLARSVHRATLGNRMHAPAAVRSIRPCIRTNCIIRAFQSEADQQKQKNQQLADKTFPFSRPSDSKPPKEYEEMRKKCPLAQARLFDGSPVWLVTKLDDLRSVLSDDRFSKVRTNPGFPELSPGAKAAIEGHQPTFVDMDPPEHTKFRGMWAHAFTPEAVEALRPGIQHKADEVIDALKLHSFKGSEPPTWKGVPPKTSTSHGEAIDLQEAFSLPFAFKVIYEMLGIPFEDYKKLSSNVAVRASGSSTARDAASAQEELTRYMLDLVDMKEKQPGRDLVSELIRTQLKPGNITKEQLAAHTFLMLVAGNATVASMINLGVVTLLQHPDQLAELKENPKLWPAAVDELCRYHTASSYALRRVAINDVQVRDQTIKAGEGVICLNQSANRDEDAFPSPPPDVFDIHREPNPHVAYGFGPHVCIAEWLARVELQVALQSLFTRLPDLQLAVPESELQWTHPDKDVGLVQLPVTWRP